MGLNNLRIAGSLLGLMILATLVAYRNSPLYLPGTLYLIAASYLNFAAVVLVAGLRKKHRRGDPEPAAWAIQTRASVLTLCGWQVAFVGLLNFWQSDSSGSQRSVIAYVLVGVFAIVSGKLVAVADSFQQEGGSQPIDIFGRPRARWMFFCLFFYLLIIPLIMMSLAWADVRWCPILLRLPQFWLLLATLVSFASAGLIFQRYREAAANRTWAVRLLIGTLLLLGMEGAGQVMWAYRVMIYVLSSITVACVAASAYWLSLAKEATSPEAIPSAATRPSFSTDIHGTTR